MAPSLRQFWISGSICKLSLTRAAGAGVPSHHFTPRAVTFERLQIENALRVRMEYDAGHFTHVRFLRVQQQAT